MTDYRYGQRWNLRSFAPVDEVDEAVARRRFEGGPWFSVSALEEGQRVPRYTLELQPRGMFVRARTYHPEGSIRAVHDYRVRDDSRDELFLETAAFYAYPDHERVYTQSECRAMVTYSWEPDGYASIDAKDKVSGRSELREFRDVPVGDHWVPIPVFGDWDRFERPPIAPPAS